MQQLNDLTRTQKIELKKKEGRVLTHVYQQSGFTFNKKLDSSLLRGKRKISCLAKKRHAFEKRRFPTFL